MQFYIVASQQEVCTRWLKQTENSAVTSLSAADLFACKSLSSGIGLVHISALLMQQWQALCSCYPEVYWVAFSDMPNDNEGMALLQAGFRGYANTFMTASLFAELVAVVERGDIWAGPSITQRLLKQYLAVGSSRAPAQSAVSAYDLTERESEVLHRVGEGASNKEIARELGITERTIKAHVTSILRKTGSKDRVALILKLNGQTA